MKNLTSTRLSDQKQFEARRNFGVSFLEATETALQSGMTQTEVIRNVLAQCVGLCDVWGFSSHAVSAAEVFFENEAVAPQACGELLKG